MVVKCDKCPYTAKFSYMIRDHQLTHSDVKVWKCEFPGCLIRLKSKKNLKRHALIHETAPEDRKHYRCEFNSCDYKFNSKSNLKAHVAAKHTPQRARNFQCSLCPKSFFGAHVLKTHIRTHVKELKLSCRYCSFSTYSEPSLVVHMRTLHEKPVKYSCTFRGCKFSTAYSNSWAGHVRLHDPDPQVRRPFPCNFPGCDFRASQKGNVKKHFRARHKANRPREFMCSLCSKAFYSSTSLNGHLNAQHTTESVYSCGKCSYLTPYSGNMSRHMREKHGVGPMEIFECEMCGYRANQRCTIRKHMMNVHAGAEKQFKCDKPGCNYETNFSSDLKRHLLVHAEDIQSHFPFACSFPDCDFRRKTNAERVQHGLQHETCKFQLTCKICSKSGYPDEVSLRFHSFRYHDQRPWKCSICDYAVCYKRTLQRHSQTHHETGSVEVQAPGSDRRSGIGTGPGSTSPARSSGILWKHSVEDRIPIIVILERIGINWF